MSAIAPLATVLMPADYQRVDRRQGYQAQRIQEGVQTGMLTETEAARLDRIAQRIAASEAAAMESGLTAREARQLERLQDRASTAIYLANHNERTVDVYV
jgi:hypothetical protein